MLGKTTWSKFRRCKFQGLDRWTVTCGWETMGFPCALGFYEIFSGVVFFGLEPISLGILMGVVWE